MWPSNELLRILQLTSEFYKRRESLNIPPLPERVPGSQECLFQGINYVCISEVRVL